MRVFLITSFKVESTKGRREKIPSPLWGEGGSRRQR